MSHLFTYAMSTLGSLVKIFSVVLWSFLSKWFKAFLQSAFSFAIITRKSQGQKKKWPILITYLGIWLRSLMVMMLCSKMTQQPTFCLPFSSSIHTRKSHWLYNGSYLSLILWPCQIFQSLWSFLLKSHNKKYFS